MSKLIFVSGMTGTGKTTTVRKYASRAYCLHADRLYREATRRAFPFMKRAHAFNPDVWPRDLSTMHVDELLRISLRSVHAGLEYYSGDIIAESAYLSDDWIRNALQDALGMYGHTFDASDVSMFHLVTPLEQVFNNVHKRASEDDYRRHEKQKFPTIQSVINNRRQYYRSITDESWIHCDSADVLEGKINIVLHTA